MHNYVFLSFLLPAFIIGCSSVGAKSLSRTPASQEATQNLELARSFFTSFQNIKPSEMAAHYVQTSKPVFSDPMFGVLNSVEAAVMWQMILRGGTAKIDLKFDEPVLVDADTARVAWVAVYDSPVPGLPQPEKFKVTNRVVSELKIVDGKIELQNDQFDRCAWAKMAVPGTTDTNCEAVFDKVSSGFRANLQKQVACVVATGKGCP